MQTNTYHSQTNKEIHRQTQRYIDRHKDTQTDTNINRHKQSYTDRRERQTDT